MVFLLKTFFFLLPFQFALAPVKGVDLAVARVAVLGITLIWLTGALLRKSLWIPRGATGVLLVSFLFLSAFSIPFSSDAAWGVRKLAFLVNFIPLYFVLSDTFHRYPDSVPGILRSVVSGATMASLIALGQFAIQFIFGVPATVEFWRSTMLPVFLGPTFGDAAIQYSSLLVNVHGMTLLRASAFFPDPHIAAYFFGISAALTFGLARSTEDRKWSAAGSVLILADLLTFSRGGYLGLAALGLVFGTTVFRKSLPIGRQRKYFILATGMLIVGVLAVSFTPVGERLRSSFSLTEGSNMGRLAMWSAGVDAVMHRPLTGVGLGNFPLFVKPSADYREPIYAHNLFLDTAAETGILGGIAFMGMLVAAFLAAWHGRDYGPLLGATAALALFFAHSLVENPLFSVHILPLLLLTLALTAGELRPDKARPLTL